MYSHDMTNHAATFACGELCVVNKPATSPTLCVVISQEEAVIECYEVMALTDNPSTSVDNWFLLSEATASRSAEYLDLRQPIFTGPMNIASRQGQLSASTVEALLRALVQRQVKRYSQHKFQSKDFEQLMVDNPELKQNCYDRICEACILKYDSKELGIDDVTETDTVVDEI